MPGDTYQPQELETLTRMAGEGYSREEISRELQRTPDAVRAKLKSLGMPVPMLNRRRRGSSAAAAQMGQTPQAQPSQSPQMPPRMPEPAMEAGGTGLPESIAKPLTAVHANRPGWWLVLGDAHIPFHDRATIEAAVAEARDKKAVGVLLNGDTSDMFGISPFFRVPTRDRFIDEINAARQFRAWLRSRFPDAEIIEREGNHEFRLRRYIADRAAALYDLEEIHLPALLHLEKHGIQWVQDKRKVMLGKLITLHGHELRKGEGINPARLAFLRTTCSVLVGHHHRTSEHHQRALDDRHFAVWSVGCACFLHPDYDPYSQSNHGYAMVEVAADGWFSVHNRRVLQGRVV